MPLYRITFTTPLIVDAPTGSDARRLASRFLAEEVSNGISQIESTELLSDPEQLERSEWGCLPWRDPSRDRDGEPERTVNQILGEE
jgi:hypothetical protein